MHLDSSNSEQVDSMNRDPIQSGWIHHLAHNFSAAASYPGSAAAVTGAAAAAAVAVSQGPALPSGAISTHHLKFSSDTSPTSLKIASAEPSPIDQTHPHFTELRSVSQVVGQPAGVTADHAWPHAVSNPYLAVAAASNGGPPSSMMHPVVSRNSFVGSAGVTSHPSAAHWPHNRSPYTTNQFTPSAEQVAAAYRTGCNLNIMNAAVNAASLQVGDPVGVGMGVNIPHHHQASTAAAAQAAAAAMHAMPFYMPTPPGGQHPFAAAAAVSHHPHHPYAASVTAADIYNDHTSSTFRYNPATGKTRTKDKYRVVYTDRQRAELENEFRSAQYITIRRKSELAMQVGLSERQVKIWFQNRRAKERKVSRKVPGSENPNSDIEESDSEVEDDEESSPSKSQIMSPPGICQHNGQQLTPKQDPGVVKAANVNDLYVSQLA